MPDGPFVLMTLAAFVLGGVTTHYGSRWWAVRRWRRHATRETEKFLDYARRTQSNRRQEW